MDEKKLRIFVVDDDKEIAETHSTMVELTGHEVFTFNDPYIALQSFMKVPPDLVITDLNMPNIDGFSMIRRMKERQKQTEFIIITGEKNVRTVFEARGLGVFLLFFKPIELDNLENAIDKVYKRTRYWIDMLKEVRIGGSQ